MKAQFFAAFGVAAIIVFLTGNYANAGGQLTAFKPVLLQASTPGTPQAGHVNISGTANVSSLILTNNGTAVNPAIGFTTDSLTGMFLDGPGNLSFAANGSTKLSVGMTNSNFLNQLLIINGTAGTPSIGFASDSNTGIFRSAEDFLNLSTGGANRVQIGNTSTTVNNALLCTNGNVGAPAISFLTDTDTGIFRSVANQLDIATGGANRFSFNSTGLGINNATPDRLLHIVESSLASPSYSTDHDLILETTGDSGIHMLSPSGILSIMMSNSGNSDRGEILYDVSSGDMLFINGSTVTMAANNLNRVGVRIISAQSELHVFGTITGSVKNFLIDHPLEPERKFLRHSCIESNEYKNIYDGTVVTNAYGYAFVKLPSWFEALNENFRYQLTVIDDSEEFVLAKVVEEVFNGEFRIRTSKPGIKVSWQISGTRKDEYARDNPILVEEVKPANEIGNYLYPEGFGYGDERKFGGSLEKRNRKKN